MTEQETQELENCLCCNGEAKWDMQQSDGILRIRYYAIVCKECGLATKYYCEESKYKTLESWNNRAQTKREAALVDALEKARDTLEDVCYLASYDAVVKSGKLQKLTDSAIKRSVQTHYDIEQIIAKFKEKDNAQ